MREGSRPGIRSLGVGRRAAVLLLPIGALAVSAAFPVAAQARGVSNVATASHGGHPSSSVSSLAELRAKAESQAPKREGGISGFVLGARGPARAGECVVAAPLAGGTDVSSAVRPGGSFALSGLAAGEYRLAAAGCSLAGSPNLTSGGGQLVHLVAGQRLSWVFVREDPATSPGPGQPAAGPGRTTSGSALVRRETQPQQTSSGSISGTVTAAAGGAGVAGICVEAGSASGAGASATTVSGGTYTVNNLPAGSYGVTFTDGCGNTTEYATQYYPGQVMEGTSQTVSVTAGVTTSGIDASLQPGGTISGTVTDSAGTALPGICVSIPDGGSSTTTASGSYNIVGVPLGGTAVLFNTCPGPTNTYSTQVYPNDTSMSAATPVVLTSAGQTATGIDDALMTLGGISGTVTDSSDVGISGICVSATAVNGALGVGASTYLAPAATSSSNGTYTISGVEPGAYQVTFAPGCGTTGSYAPQFYPGVSLSSGAKDVVVSAGATATSINAALPAPGSIAGSVSPATAGVCVDVSPSGGASLAAFVNSAVTSGTGSYDVSGLPPGSYVVSFASGCGYSNPMVTTYYSGALGFGTATPIQVAAGQTVTGIDGTVSAGGSISGTVTDATTGLALPGICVSAFASDGQSGSATSASDGTYTISGLGTDQYVVGFGSGCGSTGNYAFQYYQGASSPASATSVNVIDGQTTGGINATMVAESLASLNLTVTLGPADLPGAGVCLFEGGPGGFGGGAFGNANGTETLTGLPPGTYQFTFSATGYCGSFGNYETETVTETLSPGQAVSVTTNLPTGSVIEGTVTNQGGAGLGDVCVAALPTGPGSAAESFLGFPVAMTGPTGTYSIMGLAAGAYQVEFFTSGCGTGIDYAYQYYPGVSSASRAGTLTVGAGATMAGINATMSPGADISGVVTSTAGDWLMGICVFAMSSNGAAALVPANYYYQITGLPAGTYIVAFFTGCGQFPPDVAYQYYQNTELASSATPLTLSAGQSQTGINATMGPGGAISGTVTDSSGAPVPGICVYWGTNDPSGAVTGANGTYVLEGLPQGSATVEFTTGCGSTVNYPDQYYNGVDTASAATPVPVTVGQTTPNIDAVMGAITSGPPGPPGTPSGVAEPSAVSLSWSAPSSSGGSAVSGYVVTPYIGGTPQPALQTNSTQTSYTVTGLTDGTAYSFTVAAENASGTGPASSSSAAVTPVAPNPATYNPLTPYRICDTRGGNPSNLSGLDLSQCEGKTLNAGGTLTIQVAGTNPSGQSSGGVPSSATSVVLNVTVTNTTVPSYLTVYPTGGARPLSSSVNWNGGQTVPNLVTVALGTNGDVSLYNANGNADVVVDVEGWYDSTGASGGPYVPLTPYRICDTRPPVFTPQNQCTGKTLQAGTTLTIQVAGTNPLGTTSGGVPASGVLAVDLTVTATNPTVPSYLTVWPAGATRPTASNLNFLGAETVANNVVVAVPQSGADAGEVSIYNANGSTDVVVDVSGYYATTTGPGLFVPMVPYRICDTRSTAISGLTDSCTGHTLVASGTSGAVLVLQVAGVGGIPANATSVVLNVTVTDTTAADYLTVYPDGSTRPNSSSLNWPAGETVASGVTATLGAGGALDFYIPQGAADLVVDVVGWEE